MDQNYDIYTNIYIYLYNICTYTYIYIIYESGQCVPNCRAETHYSISPGNITRYKVVNEAETNFRISYTQKVKVEDLTARKNIILTIQLYKKK